MLQYYHSDLTYIMNFQRYKQNVISRDDYLPKSPGSFQSFLNEFRIARNVHKQKVPELLKRTKAWVHTKQADDVDRFANALREENITHNKTMVSLASKILCLNNPWVIIPCDTLTRKILGVETNAYSNFYSAFHDKLGKEMLRIDDSLKPLQVYIYAIENGFKEEIDDIITIRRNRFLDKLLWVHGQKFVLSRAYGTKKTLKDVL